MKQSRPPKASVLQSFENANLKWWIALGEWIDNCLDARASTIAFEFTKHALLIVDDGIGCLDPGVMVQLGEHVKHSSTQLGRYGIGGKDAALWVGGVNSSIDIRTAHDGVMRSLLVKWLEYANDDWSFEEAVERPLAPNESSGTSIAISPRVRHPPRGQPWQELVTELGYVFAPALKQGHQIKFKGPSTGGRWAPLVRWELPAFDGEVIDARIEVNGKSARVYCGVVAQGEPNLRGGFTYSHRWRVIERASAHGCGDFSTARVCGFVEIDASWPLTKNKDGVSRDADALYAEVARVARPVLERAESIGMELQSRQFRMHVNARLNAQIAAADRKAKRSRGANHGTKNPTGNGRPHRQAKHDQPGNRFHARGNGLDVDYVDLGRPDDLGQVKVPGRILLNLANPMIAQCRREQNVEAIVIAAASLIGFHSSQSDKPLLKLLPMNDASGNGFSRTVGSILSETLFVDGRPALVVA
jgi:hypothetical protein